MVFLNHSDTFGMSKLGETTIKLIAVFKAKQWIQPVSINPWILPTTSSFNHPSNLSHFCPLEGLVVYMSILERVADDMVWHTDFMSVQLGLSLMGSYVKN